MRLYTLWLLGSSYKIHFYWLGSDKQNKLSIDKNYHIKNQV